MNAYLNLAWTGPIDNAFLDKDITLGKVEGMAADLFLRSVVTDGAAETALDSQEAAADVEAKVQRGKPRRRAVETLSHQGRRPWNIPNAAEKGFEVPVLIASVNLSAAPEVGKFKRLGMDVLVTAVWLA